MSETQKPPSPLFYSALSMWRRCPKQYEAAYILKNVPTGTNPAIERGNRLHKALEEMVKGKDVQIDEEIWLPDGLIDRMRDAGAKPEVPLAVDERWEKTDFWDKRGLLRGKIDVLGVYSKQVVMVDWKTGKFYPDEFQADVYATLVRSIFHAPSLPVRFGWVFVDPKVKKEHVIDVDAGAFGRVQSVVSQVRNAKEFPAKPNPLCGWCPVKSCRFSPAFGKDEEKEK